MRYRPLGNTDVHVSEIGFGAWGIGGVKDGAIAYGPTDDDASRRALARAFELGVTFYDTSDLYGHGHSERLIGEAFHDCRAQVIIASKAGFVDAAGTQDFTPKHLRAALEGTLRRLQSEYVDLYQLHDAPVELLERETRILETLETMRQEGKIRAIGTSARSPNEALVAVERLGIQCVQVNFNMADQRAVMNGLMDLCRAKGVGVICRTPLCLGFLTGKYTAGTVFDVQDYRRAWSTEQIAMWANAHRLFAPVLSAPGQTPAQVALRFCLSYPAVSTVIPGMLTVAEVEENVAASRFGPLPAVERLAIERVARETSFFIDARPAKTHALHDPLVEREVRAQGAV